MAARQSGVTLVEALVTVGVLAVLALLAAPALGELLRARQLAAASNEVFSHLVLARSEALRRNGRVALCRSAGGVQCEPGANWEQGGLLFEDLNNNGRREPRERIVRRMPPLPPGLRLLADAALAAHVSYGPWGAAQHVSGAFQAGAFTVCRPGGGEARRIVLNAGGRPRVERLWLAGCG